MENVETVRRYKGTKGFAYECKGVPKGVGLR